MQGGDHPSAGAAPPHPALARRGTVTSLVGASDLQGGRHVEGNFKVILAERPRPGSHLHSHGGRHVNGSLLFIGATNVGVQALLGRWVEISGDKRGGLRWPERLGSRPGDQPNCNHFKRVGTDSHAGEQASKLSRHAQVELSAAVPYHETRAYCLVVVHAGHVGGHPHACV